MVKYSFKVGSMYKRSEIKQAIGLDPNARGGPWYTGYAERKGTSFIFCNVGAPGRTGHDYDNYFDGGDLVWRGKTNSHQHQPMIRRMTGTGAEVHIFWRKGGHDPFTYAGLGSAIEVSNETPVRVRWQLSDPNESAQPHSKSSERLPAEVLVQVTPEYIWKAVELLIGEKQEHKFGESTDYDLIVRGGTRLPPKAVFGVAATLTLGFEILPKHFSGGEGSLCFRLLRESGLAIVPKSEPERISHEQFSQDDEDWAEGKKRLVTHLKTERARGLAPAKKSEFKRLHGRIFCERCGIDPVDHYGTAEAEACIEVHHQTIQIQSMSEGHRTRLEDVQCLCANCHRLIHRLLKVSASSNPERFRASSKGNEM